jgi:hypothetical protein
VPAESKLRLRRDPSDQESDEQRAITPGYLASLKPPKKRKANRLHSGTTQYLFSWMLFLVLAAAMGYARYGNRLPLHHVKMMAQFAPIIVAAFYILTVLKAFQDTVYQGILCLLLPPYAVIYLLMISDDFFARAVFAGLMAGLAEDAGRFFYEHGVSIAASINAWIASGG